MTYDEKRYWLEQIRAELISAYIEAEEMGDILDEYKEMFAALEEIFEDLFRLESLDD